jgi:hypothetical protein
MKFKNQNLTTLGDKFSGRIHDAFKGSSINKLYSNIEIERLITYNEILGEFINLGYTDLYNEFESRICKGECPNEVLAELITREEYQPTLGYLLGHIEYFIDKDYMEYFE